MGHASSTNVWVEDPGGGGRASLVDPDSTRQLRAAEEITGHKYETISGWLKRAATNAAAIAQVLASNLHLSQVEIDEFWSFAQKKNGVASPPDEGESWGCLVLDRESRFVVAWATGTLSEAPIEHAVTTTVQRTH